MTICNLDELLDVLLSIPTGIGEEEAALEYARRVRLPVHRGEIDYSSLPTFGGVEPPDTSEIWSWDETRLLISPGDGEDAFCIVDRD